LGIKYLEKQVKIFINFFIKKVHLFKKTLYICIVKKQLFNPQIHYNEQN